MNSVRCALPSCRVPVRRSRAAAVRLVVDGVTIAGLACTKRHADEVVRAWTTGDAPAALESIDPAPLEAAHARAELVTR